MTRRAAKRVREPVRFAVIGQGYFGQGAVLPAFRQADGCELRAIFSTDRTKLRALKRKYGVAAALGYEEYDDYLRSGEVDAVYIALPNDMHGDYTIRAARAGVHVLCEKPIATSSREAEAMIAACDDSGVKLMIAYRLHFEGATLEAIERVRRGDIGRPRFFASTFAMQVKPDNIRTRRRRGGGPLLDLGVYCVNAARALFRAEPLEVLAMSASRRREPRFKEIDEMVTAVLRFPDDRLAQFTCSFGGYDHSAMTVIGDKGRIRMDPAFEYTTALSVETDITGKPPQRKKFGKRDQIAAEMVAFADCIRDGRDPEPSGEEGLADLYAIEAVQRAAASRRIERVERIARQVRPSKTQAIRRKPHGVPQLIHAESPGR